MSSQSPQAKAAGQNAAWQANLARDLGGVAIPELQMLLGNQTTGKQGMIQGMFSGMDSSGRLPMDAANLKASTDQLNQGYGQARFGLGQNIGYAGIRSGEGRRSPFAMNSALGSAASTLEQQRIAALNNLNFASAQASMSDYNKLLGLMGQGVQTSMGLAQGFAGASNAAIGGMSDQSQLGGALGGAAAGASMGMVAGWPGIIAGGVIGGVVGGLGSG